MTPCTVGNNIIVLENVTSVRTNWIWYGDGGKRHTGLLVRFVGGTCLEVEAADSAPLLAKLAERETLSN